MKEISREKLKSLRDRVVGLYDKLGIPGDEEFSSWRNVIDGKLLPRLSSDFPLMVAICGGGSSGKSTLFNSLIGEKVSLAGGTAGLNRRVLVTAPGEFFSRRDFMSVLFEPFGNQLKKLEDRSELTKPGCPLYVLNSKVPRNMVLMDTPDFDTGVNGAFANRELVGKTLETADVLIYIFTNSNYNNQSNTDFMRKMLTGIGMRKCFLIYRIYSGFPNESVLDHANTVAKHIFGDHAGDWIIGVYRADEDNLVASGKKFMEIRPVETGMPHFNEALKELDPITLRPEIMASVYQAAMSKGEIFLARAKGSAKELHLYLDAIRAAQTRSVQTALNHFPMDMVMKRFAQMWMDTDPGHIRFMRQTGKTVGFPARILFQTAKWVSKWFSGEKRVTSEKEFKNQLDEDLLAAVNYLYKKVTSPEISVPVVEQSDAWRRMMETLGEVRKACLLFGVAPPTVEPSDETGTVIFRVKAHPAIREERETLSARDWKASFAEILSQKEIILKFTEEIDRELMELVHVFRKRMGLSAKIRQTFFAFLNILPASVAVTYVLSTGDPIGGAGLKIKLSGLFGLHDLYALVALPASAGISNTDRKKIEEMLEPIARTWLNNKMAVINDLFETRITGNCIRAGEEILNLYENAG